MAKILITGGSGLLGRSISGILMTRGHTVTWLSRSGSVEPGIDVFVWNPEKEVFPEKCLENVDCIIHLAGAGIADKRWTDERKQEIIDSRVESSAFLLKKIKELGSPVKQLIGASAIGYYGSDNSDRVYTEGDAPGSDFLARTCKLWEEAYHPFTEHGFRVCVIRIGIVLSRDGGALPVMAKPVMAGLGSPLGSGRQPMAWVHIHDLANLFVYACENTAMQGVFNGVADENVSNAEFMRCLSKQLKKPFWLPAVPSFMLQLILGERAIVVTGGAKVSNRKIKEQGFALRFPALIQALQEIYP